MSEEGKGSGKLMRWHPPAAFEGIDDNATRDVLRDIYAKLNAFHAGLGLQERIEKKRIVFFEWDYQFAKNKMETFLAAVGQSGVTSLEVLTTPLVPPALVGDVFLASGTHVSVTKIPANNSFQFEVVGVVTSVTKTDDRASKSWGDVELKEGSDITITPNPVGVDGVFEIAAPNVAPNTTHRTSDGKDHSDVVANTAAIAKAVKHVGLVIASIADPVTDFVRAGGGKTIGSAGSGATYAHAKYEALYTLIWPFATNSGAEIAGYWFDGTKGASAAIDFAANKKIGINLGGQFLVGHNENDALFDVIGEIGGSKVQGAHTHTNPNTGAANPAVSGSHVLLKGEIPGHVHTYSEIWWNPSAIFFPGGSNYDIRTGNTGDGLADGLKTPADGHTHGIAHNHAQGVTSADGGDSILPPYVTHYFHICYQV